MDNTYKERIALRKQLLEDHHDIVTAVHNESDPDPRVRGAVTEFYTFLMGTYLPGRYPTMFKLHHELPTELKGDKNVESGVPQLENLVTGEIWPVAINESQPTILALEILAKVMDEDFLVLLPERPEMLEEGAEPKYVLHAYTTCYPAGFNSREKLGLRLASIHQPVPHYREKLERSMDRYFANVKVGHYVKRVNWSITTNANLFAAFGGTHLHEDEEKQEIKPGELELDQVRLFFVPLSYGFDEYSFCLRHLSAANVKHCIACRRARHWFLPSIPTGILSRRSRMKD